MPVIRRYQQRVAAPGAQQFDRVSGAELGGATSRALGQLGKSVQGTAQMFAKRIEQQELSDTTSKMAKTNAVLAKDLQNVIKTTAPGDVKPYDEYNKRADETLAKAGEEISSLSSKNYHAQTSERIKSQLLARSVQGQSESAGIKAVVDYTESLNSYTSTAHSDPSSLGLQRTLHAEGIDALVASGQIPANKGAELKLQGEKKISKNAVRGWINMNPEYAKKKLEDGVFDKDLGGDLKTQMLAEADQAIRAKEIEAQRRRKEDERVLKEQQKVTKDKFLKLNSEGKLTTKTILGSNLNPFGSGGKESFLNMIKVNSAKAGPPKTNSAVFTDTFRRINLPDGDPERIVDEDVLIPLVGRGLSFPDMQKLRKELQGFNTEEGRIEKDMKANFLKVATDALVKGDGLGIKDPVGREQLQKFLSAYLPEFDRLKKEGVSATEMLTPGNKNYLGSMLDGFRRSQKQIFRDLKRGFTRKTPEQLAIEKETSAKKPTRNPGESSIDYIERLNAFKAKQKSGE